MNVDEIVAGLSQAERDALLQRLLSDIGPEEVQGGEAELEDRVLRLERLVGRRATGGRRSGPEWAGGPGCCHGGPWHGHHHCPSCGW